MLTFSVFIPLAMSFEMERIFAVSMSLISRALGVWRQRSEYEASRLTAPPSWSVAMKSGILKFDSISDNLLR